MIKGVEEEITSNKTCFHFGARDLSQKSEINLKLYVLENKSFFPIYASEPQRNTRKGIEWKKFYIEQNKIPEETTPMKIEVIQSKSMTVIGECEFTLKQMIEKTGKHVQLYKNSSVVGELKLIDI